MTYEPTEEEAYGAMIYHGKSEAAANVRIDSYDDCIRHAFAAGFRAQRQLYSALETEIDRKDEEAAWLKYLSEVSSRER